MTKTSAYLCVATLEVGSVGNQDIRDLPIETRQDLCKWVAQIAAENHDTIVPRLFGCPTALCVSEYPIPMQPHSHQLLSIYIRHVTSKMYPIWQHLNFNPSLGLEWYQFAVADAAMLHGLLYTGAIYAALSEGKTESQDTVYHLCQIISIVNKRLGRSGQVQESTISTLCCLVLGEVREPPFSCIPCNIANVALCRRMPGIWIYGISTCVA
jgi:hypothetical protein